MKTVYVIIPKREKYQSFTINDVYGEPFETGKLLVDAELEIREVFEHQFVLEMAQNLASIGRESLNPVYYTIRADAEQELLSRYAATWGVSVKMAASILRRRKMVDSARQKREHQQNQAWQKRINEQAQQFAELIDPRKESYAETCERMKEAIGARIESAVFHAACKIVRFKYSDAQKINL